MSVIIDLTPQEEERFRDYAKKRGTEPSALARKLIVDAIPVGLPDEPKISDENRKAIAYLQSRLAEEATNDPEEIAKAEAELAEFKRNINANRAMSGDTQVYH